MADIAKLLGGVRPADIPESQHTLAAAEDVEAGDALRLDADTNRFTRANATAAGEAGFYGIAATSQRAGQGVTAIRRGKVAGYDVSGMAPGAAVYLSNTDGALADAAGTVSVQVGRVVWVGGESGQKIVEVG